MFGIPTIEWVGYLASLLVALSLTMSSIIKLRWINLVGAVLFTIYALIINALPVALVNGFISVVNVYFLVRISGKKEAFKLFHVDARDRILNEFLNFHSQDIIKLAPEFDFNVPASGMNYLVMRNMDIAGVFIGEKAGNDELEVLLDYVSPKYRDFKLGDFVYRKDSEIFRDETIQKVRGKAKTKAYRTYFERMGFQKVQQEDDWTEYKMELNP
jgi:hypothetical protein